MSMSDTILSVKNLHVDFTLPLNTIHAVKGVDFSLKKGETLALVGQSGSGKSISAMSILQLLPYPMASHPQGEIFFKGENLMDCSPQQLRKIRGNGIGMIFQEPMTALNPLQTIYAQIAESIVLHNPKISKVDVTKRVLELLELVHLVRAKERMYAYPHELSGGQRQRVVIAMALANNPEVLIADEPTTALDVTVQQKILELLMELQAKFNMSILFITHDLTVVQKIADTVCVMNDGRIVESGTVDDVMHRPQHPYTKKLLASDVQGMKKPYSVDAPVILQADNVTVEFPLQRNFFGAVTTSLKAVDAISVTVKQGQTIGIVGESGSGKSTLGKALLHLLDSSDVSIDKLTFEDSDITHIGGKALQLLRREIQVVFQDPFGALSPRMTISDILCEGLNVHFPTLTQAEKNEKIIEVVQDVALDVSILNRYPHEFSGGQRQRIAIARALILRPKFLFLDEPTSALDRNVQVQVVNLLRDLQIKYKMTYLFISHDLAVVKALSDDVIVMQNGKVVEANSVEKIFESPKQEYTKTLIESAFSLKRIKTS